MFNEIMILQVLRFEPAAYDIMILALKGDSSIMSQANDNSTFLIVMIVLESTFIQYWNLPQSYHWR
jgi:hypothetical protein